MLLLALRRPGGALLVVSPILWFAAAVPALGLLGLPWLMVAALRSGEGTLWALVVMYAFFLGVPAYAFTRAALARQVQCVRQAGSLRAITRGQTLEASLALVRLEVTRRRVGLTRPVTLHEVELSAPGWPGAISVHSGLTPWTAQAAARRLREQLGVTESPRVKPAA